MPPYDCGKHSKYPEQLAVSFDHSKWMAKRAYYCGKGTEAANWIKSRSVDPFRTENCIYRPHKSKQELSGALNAKVGLGAYPKELINMDCEEALYSASMFFWSSRRYHW